jgi:hypothetical protein
MKIKLSRPYFAHPINLYNTPFERSLVRLIACYFGISMSNVENPNQPHHEQGYQLYAKRASQSATKHNGMGYFYDEVLPYCDGSVAMPFLDGRMAIGVAGETGWFDKECLPTLVIHATREITPDALRLFEEDPHSGVFGIRLLTPDEKVGILAKDPKYVVPHEETRLRTQVVYGGAKRPFEESHLVCMPIPPGFYPDKK